VIAPSRGACVSGWRPSWLLLLAAMSAAGCSPRGGSSADDDDVSDDDDASDDDDVASGEHAEASDDTNGEPSSAEAVSWDGASPLVIRGSADCAWEPAQDWPFPADNDWYRVTWSGAAAVSGVLTLDAAGATGGLGWYQGEPQAGLPAPDGLAYGNAQKNAAFTLDAPGEQVVVGVWCLEGSSSDYTLTITAN
jgi:hypothetical protein